MRASLRVCGLLIALGIASTPAACELDRVVATTNPQTRDTVNDAGDAQTDVVVPVEDAPSTDVATPDGTMDSGCRPTREVCNGLDDDCNGLVDDGLGTLSCGVGACGATTPACVGGVAVACRPGTPSPEVCNGVDDDCDGTIDNGLSCPGACGAGRVDCDGNPTNGCEIDTQSDAANCGACGTACRPGATCTAGVCG